MKKTKKTVRAWAIIQTKDAYRIPITDMYCKNKYGVHYPWSIFRTKVMAQKTLKAALDYHKESPRHQHIAIVPITITYEI